MGNKTSSHPNASPIPPMHLNPLEDELTEIIARPIKENDVRFKDLNRFSERISIFDTVQNEKEMQLVQIIDKGNNITEQQMKEEKEEKEDNEEKIDAEVEHESHWLRMKNIIMCLSELYSKYNFNRNNIQCHKTICRLLENSNNLANKPMQLTELFTNVNNNNNLALYSAFNILSGICQSGINVAFNYMTFKYFKKNGYDAISDVATNDGWQIYIYFNYNNNGNIRIVSKKQGRKVAKIKNKMDTQFIIDWELDSIYNTKSTKCVSVRLQSIGFSYFHPKLSKKQKNKINTELMHGKYVIYEYTISD